MTPSSRAPAIPPDAIPADRARLVLALVAAHPEGRLALSASPEGTAMLDGIDLSPGALGRTEGVPPAWVSGGGADLRGAQLGKASLVGADLRRANLTGADLRGANLRGANLEGAVLDECNLEGADFASANLRRCSLGNANLRSALLEETRLEGASLRFANLTGAVLESAHIRGADLWGANLEGSALAGADLQGCVLREANLAGADLARTTLRDAALQGACLDRAILHEADLRGAELRGSSLRGAVLRDAQLQGVVLHGCDLAHAHFSGAWLEKTRLGQEQLGGALGEELAGEFEEGRKAYLALERNFADLGNTDASAWAYLKKRRMGKREAYRQARAALREWRWRAALARASRFAADQLAEWVCDYGESVPRVMASLLAVYLFFMVIYAVTGSVVRVQQTAAGVQRSITRDPTDLAVFSLMAMTTSGTPAVGLQPRTDEVHLLTGVQALLGIALTGLLGFVLGNRIRR